MGDFLIRASALAILVGSVLFPSTGNSQDQAELDDAPSNRGTQTNAQPASGPSTGSAPATGMCDKLAKTTDFVCQALKQKSQISMALAGFSLGGAIGQAQANAGNACISGKKAFEMASLPARVTGYTCASAAAACIATCSGMLSNPLEPKKWEIKAKLKTCTKNQAKYAPLAIAFGETLNALGRAIERSCNRNIATANCSGPDAASRPECSGGPVNPGPEFPNLLGNNCTEDNWRMNPLLCKDFACKDAQYANSYVCKSDNPTGMCDGPQAQSDLLLAQMCRCQANPTQQGCPGSPVNPGAIGGLVAGGTAGGGAGTTAGGDAAGGMGDLLSQMPPNNWFDSGDFNPEDNLRRDAPEKVTGRPLADAVGNGGAASGGALAGGGGAPLNGAPMMPHGGGSDRGEDPQILSGVAAAPAPGPAGPGLGSETSGGGDQGSLGGRRPKDEELDLKAFLPGQKNYHGRLPASADVSLLAVGITGANGESNFEKITRKYQEKWRDRALVPAL